MISSINSGADTVQDGIERAESFSGRLDGPSGRYRSRGDRRSVVADNLRRQEVTTQHLAVAAPPWPADEGPTSGRAGNGHTFTLTGGSIRAKPMMRTGTPHRSR